MSESFITRRGGEMADTTGFIMALEIDYTKIDAALTDYPVLVMLDSTNFDFTDVRNDGNDIKFTDSSGNLLAFEIEMFDLANEIAIYHVKIPSVSSTANTVFYCHYGFDNVEDYSASYDNPTAVWDSDFVLVHHLGRRLLDSTSYKNDGLNYGTTVADALYGKGRSFTSDSHRITFGNDSSLQVNNLTITMLQQRTTPTSATAGGICYGTVFGPSAEFSYYLENIANSVKVAVSDLSAGANAINANADDTDYHVCTGRYDGTNVSVNIDDTAIVTTAYNNVIDYPPNPDLLILGGRTNNTYGLRGIVKELRISKVARSNAWVKADYHNLLQNDLIIYPS